MPPDETTYRPRHRGRGRRPARPLWLSRLLGVGRAVVYLGTGLFIVCCVGIGVVAHADRDAPRTWGTFTEEHRESRLRGGDSVTGTWVSDDGSIVLHDVAFDGGVGSEGTARAYAQPEAMLGGDDVVHDGSTDGWGVVIGPGLALMGVFFLLGRMSAWGDLERLRLRWRRARRTR